MQVYAGLVDSLDENIGRLIGHLRDSGQLDNTVIIFISDNGPEGNDPYQILDNATWVPKAWKTDTASLGQPGAFASYGPGWAEVSATPFRFYKAFTGEGGIRVPGIFVLPGHKAAGRIERNVGTVLDIMPSVLEMAGVSYPRTDGNGRALLPLDGTSLLPLLNSRTPAHGADDGIGWERFGRRALLLGDWKLLWVDAPYGTGEWQLFDLASDPFERRDLAAEKPAKLREMLAAWRAYMRRSNVKLMDYSGLQYGKINEHYQH
jgi:arylsulfatase